MCKSERQNCRTIVCVLNRLSEGLHDRKRESARFSLLNLNILILIYVLSYKESLNFPRVFVLAKNTFTEERKLFADGQNS